MVSGTNGERCKTTFSEEIWNDLHYKLYGMGVSTPSWVDLEKDIITKTIGRKSVMKPNPK
jgi:endonuclease-3